jgi:sugar lactone lactonase YvrE
VTTFAGGTNYVVTNNPPVTIVTGFTNGTGTNSRFNGPKGIVWDGSGNLYVADSSNNAIRKIVISSAAVTTFAGSATPGSTNGTGVSASFYNPLGISVDTSGNFYVCDTNNNLLRKITTSAVVTTLAGGGVSSGSSDGTGIAATFNSLKGVSYDGSGNLFLCDTANNLIRKIVISTALVTTLAGSTTPGSANGTGTNARFNGPIGLTCDTSGNLYIVDTGNNMIRKIVISSGVVSTVAGSTTPGSTDAIGTNASFNTPDCACTDTSGNLYVSDTGNNRIRKIALSSATVTTLAGSTQGFVNGNGVSAQFNQPVGLIMNQNSSAMYVSDAGNNVIRIIT